MGAADLKEYLVEVEAHIARFSLLEYSSIVPGGWLTLSHGNGVWAAALSRRGQEPIETEANTCHDVVASLRARL